MKCSYCGGHFVSNESFFAHFSKSLPCRLAEAFEDENE